MQNSDRSIFCIFDICMQIMPKNMQNNMQNMQKICQKICNPVFNMQNSDRFIFCIFCIYIHSPLCWCTIMIVYPSDRDSGWKYHVLVYPWIYHVYRPSIFMVYPWMYMVYHWMYIHGIYVVYCGISAGGMVFKFLAFWNQMSLPARAAGLIQFAHVCGWSRVFYSTLHHGYCASLRGKGGRQLLRQGKRQLKRKNLKRLNQTANNVRRLSLVAAVTVAAAAVSRASFRFPSLVASNDLPVNLGERWGRGCLQNRWPMCRTA